MYNKNEGLENDSLIQGDNMKVGILTFHASHNYGSMLQAYALQKVVTKLGHECKIINFRTKRQKQMYDYRNVVKKEQNIFKKLIKILFFGNAKKQHERFENFLKTYLPVTKEYSDIDEFEHGSDEFDIYISGSDQIWNVDAHDFNKIYMLDFNKEGKRVAYAVSAGSGRCSLKGYEKEIRKYDAIGVREFALGESLKSELGIQSKLTLDPTLLLSASEWNELRNKELEKKLPDKYIFFYSLGYGDEELEILKYIDKSMGNIPILTPHRLYTREVLYKNFKVIKACGPREFVSLVANASFVFTTSFHGCIFSTIYKRNFLTYLPNEGHIDERKQSLLALLGETKRGVCSLEDVKKYGNASNKSIDNQVTDSINFLKIQLDK
jgi:hypothetical protein